MYAKLHRTTNRKASRPVMGYTLGFAWKADAHAQWSAYYAYGLPKTVNGSASIPVNFGGGEANIRLKENLLGLAFGWKF